MNLYIPIWLIDTLKWAVIVAGGGFLLFWAVVGLLMSAAWNGRGRWGWW